MGAVPRRPGERRRRRPGRDHQGGHPHGRHVRDARPRPARLRRARSIRDGVLLLRPQAHRPARRAVVLDAVPGHADPGDARRRPADGGRPPGGREPADQGRRRRRGARATCRATGARSSSAGQPAASSRPRTEGGPRADRFQGAIFDVDGVLVDSPHEKAWRESLRELMEGEWSDIRDQTTWSPEAFTPQVYQEAMSGKPRMSGARAALEYFHVPDADGTRAEYAERKQAMVVRAHRGRRLHRLPRRAAVHHRRQGRRDPRRGRLVVQEREAVPAPDPARHFRARARHLLAVAAAGPDAARLLRRRRLGPGLRARQAPPRDVPHRGARARGRARGRDRHGGRRRRGRRRPRPAAWPRSASRAPTTPTCWPRPGPTSWSPPSTRWIWPPCDGRLERTPT